jgi:NADH:ubiquinone oxidoreductase subunit K
VLNTVLLAAVLFLVAISQRFTVRHVRLVLLGAACILLAVALHGVAVALHGMATYTLI